MLQRFFCKAFLVLLIVTSNTIFGQPLLKGPTCVVAGTVYEYNIAGTTDTFLQVRVCIAGGNIADSNGNETCTPLQSTLSKILVTWDALTLDSGYLSLSSSLGNSQLSIHFTDPLLPGLIDSSSKVQFIEKDSLPATIFCLANSGGSCSPSYSYQWQQSGNAISWADIKNASSDSLHFVSFLTADTYYRRKVTETSSGTIAYSDVAVVFIKQTSGKQ